MVQDKKDASIAERIHKKVVKLGQESPIDGPGYFQGRHFTTYVNDVKDLKKKGELDAAEELLVNIISVIEAEGESVAPWYYEELAKIYRKQKNYTEEVAILERFAIQKHAPGAKPAKLLERLEKARQLVETRK